MKLFSTLFIDLVVATKVLKKRKINKSLNSRLGGFMLRGGTTSFTTTTAGVLLLPEKWLDAFFQKTGTISEKLKQGSGNG
jgi:hypothetical protein